MTLPFPRVVVSFYKNLWLEGIYELNLVSVGGDGKRCLFAAI